MSRAVADANGVASFDITLDGLETRRLTVRVGDVVAESEVLRVLPGWVSIAPPLLAIFVALFLRSVIPAMVLGIWFGTMATHSFSPVGAVRGLLDAFQVHVVAALADPDHAAIVLFSLMIGGMIGIVTRNGGMAAIVHKMIRLAKTAVSAQVSVWLMGMVIFFDDYSNTLVVGNTARALTDRLRVSREKLAYVVDSTAAPVACLALMTTWIGYEVGLIDAAIANIADIETPAYTLFLYSLPFSFYPILAIVFVLMVATSGRDFGPMLAAESRARGGQVAPASEHELPALHGDNLEAKDGVPMRSVNGYLPIIAMVATLVVGLVITGKAGFAADSDPSWTDIVGAADAYKAMLWASLVGAFVAAFMTIGQRILNTHETVDAWFGGVRAMLFAMIVLVLAWTLSSVTEALHTADWLVSVLADSLPAPLVPTVVFVLSAITAFTTGTSWGTLGILMPLVIPLTWAVMLQNGLTSPEDMHILYAAIASNLAGAVWGDHCSPISDTTVLSSMASGCDHIEHVRTQMPYAMLVGIVAIGIGILPAGFGLPPLVSIVVAAIVLGVVLRQLGRPAAMPEGDELHGSSDRHVQDSTA